jgi:predicted O-methyltransferase YrrM
MKALHLLSLLPRNPREFAGRLVTIGEGRLELLRDRPTYSASEWRAGLALLGASLRADLQAGVDESPLIEIEGRVRALCDRIPPEAPFRSVHNADPLFARLCYALARALHPKLVVETGVCYGVTSAYLLQALAANSSGHLHSIDLPPLGKNGDDFVGWLVAKELRSRWTLHRGTSRLLLGPLLADLGQIDLYIHDSLHTYKNMSHEFRLSWSNLRPGGVLISDDIEGNTAFAELAAVPDALGSVVMKESEKESLVGVVVKAGLRT